jgi:hypothetical protein
MFESSLLRFLNSFHLEFEPCLVCVPHFDVWLAVLRAQGLPLFLGVPADVSFCRRWSKNELEELSVLFKELLGWGEKVGW